MISPEKVGFDFLSLRRSCEKSKPYQRIGKVYSSKGPICEVSLSRAIIGSTVEFVTEFGESCMGEIIGIAGKRCFAMPYRDMTGINSETKVYLRDLTTTIPLSPELLGRIVDFRCSPIDKLGPINFGVEGCETRSIFGKAINPLDRPEIKNSLDTGVHAIDCFMTAGKGQRLAIMAGSGVGKSVTLGMIAQNTNADINVIALIGERGREVSEFIENDLGKEGLERSVVVTATSDESPLARIKAAYVATTIAEYFRDCGNDVLFLMDSITRFAMANREISVVSGDIPGPRGYSPSVFPKLSKIFERAGTISTGKSITGFYTVLVEGGDLDEPISDSVRAISDGHIILSRDLASSGHFPAIDILASISRLMNKVVTREHRIVANYLRGLLAAYRDNEGMILAGAYAKGTNVKVDKAICIYEDLTNLMKQEQGMMESFSREELYEKMVEIARKAEMFSKSE